jgi:hypothetical protein
VVVGLIQAKHTEVGADIQPNEVNAILKDMTTRSEIVSKFFNGKGKNKKRPLYLVLDVFTNRNRSQKFDEAAVEVPRGLTTTFTSGERNAQVLGPLVKRARN